MNDGAWTCVDQQTTDAPMTALLPLLEKGRLGVVVEGGVVTLLTSKDMDAVRQNRALPPTLLFRGEDVYLLFPKHKDKVAEFLTANGWNDKVVKIDRPVKEWPDHVAYRVEEAHKGLFMPRYPEEIDVILPNGGVVGFDQAFEVAREASAPAAELNAEELLAALGIDAKTAKKIAALKALNELFA
jgi:hypothetical protein